MTTEQAFIDRRGTSLVKTIIAGIVGPLVVALVLGYTAMHTTINKLALLAEQADKRINTIEQTTKDHDKEYRAIQLLLVKHTQMLETIYKDFMAERSKQ